jgi:hypothetical protein
LGWFYAAQAEFENPEHINTRSALLFFVWHGAFRLAHVSGQLRDNEY